VEMALDCTLTSRDISNPLLKHGLFASLFPGSQSWRAPVR
jgi:hypothetical protein